MHHGPASPTPSAVADARGRAWVPVLLVVLGVICLAVTVPLFRHGIAAHAFPSYVQGDPSYEVRRYSAPWIAGAVALGGLGLICWSVAGGLWVRGRRSPAPAQMSPSPVAVDAPAGLAPRPTEAAREY
ncbi:hypothetical protein [Nakamurella deserti]|uniref:hypothetical protein n=1 Tax=Nakamurella deserti TaxID=2164074 RepID=UPI000DBE7DDA|nr:hypothetical protein [Nakamurella deserti]